MNESFPHLQEFLQAASGSVSQKVIPVSVCFATTSREFRFDSRLFVDLDARLGAKVTLLEHPKNFEFDYHTEFKADFTEMRFAPLARVLTVRGDSKKIGRYEVTIKA